MHMTLQYNVISGECNGAAVALEERNETTFVHARTETRNCSLQASKHNLNCSGSAVSKRAKVLVMKARSRDVLTQYSLFGLLLIFWQHKRLIRRDCSKVLRSWHNQQAFKY